MKGIGAMNPLRFFVVVLLPLILGLPLAAQTPQEEIGKLQARIRDLEAENAKLKETLAKKAVGSLGVLHGQIVTIEGEYDPKTPIKSIYDFRVASVNGKALAGDVHVYMKKHEWARSAPAAGKTAGVLKLKGFQCTESVGDPFGRTGLAFHLVEVFMIVEVLGAKGK
jgi:hypothetical protein